MSQETEILITLYNSLISQMRSDGIPVNLRPANIIGTIQDDPFDCWVEMELKSVLPQRYEVFHVGRLTTPDIIVRDKETGSIIGLEIKN